MSGPYRFAGESTKSPLEQRAQQQFPAPGQPVSFKTNVNRAKTKKWVEAKKNAYDGDDWGEYDEYDEYGAEAPPQPISGPRGYGQRFDQQPARSFTEPQRQGAPQPGRRNSFEAGEEQRAFSSSMGPPPQQYQQYAQPAGPAHPAPRQASGAESDISDTPQHRRDFSPNAMPPPLQTRFNAGPGSASGSPNTQYPPRKSSIGQVDSPTAMSPRERAPSNPGKALPFIRPADIYKRHEEERQRERASQESSRPSMDSIMREPADDAAKSLHPLETVAERKSEYIPDVNVQPSLPEVKRMSTFGSDFLPRVSQQETSAPADQGFREAVDSAFTRTDESRSIPPTPVTNDSGVSRSNTDSTSGISPIMSRVPSSALKVRNMAGGDGSTPVIAEEASDTGTPVSRPTTAVPGGAQSIARKPSPGHSRNVSGSSAPRSGLATPTPGESPARSPAFAPQEHVPEPEIARLSSPDAMEGGLDGPSPTYATREADLVSAARMSPPGTAAPELRAAQNESQTAFLESHSAQSSIDDALPRSRSESPSKGRVQELAGRFGDVSSSRRGSTQSNTSRNSVQSWERSRDNSRPSSPTKADSPTKEIFGARPTADREASFRPKLPGQWESYATTAATPYDQGRELGNDHADAAKDSSSPLGDIDLTPTTAKHPVLSADPSEPASDPLSALKAAGAAMGEAVMATVGRRPSRGEDDKRNFPHGDVLPRPLQLAREPSAVSTIPPTPPAKDTPESEFPPPPPLKEKRLMQQSPSSSEQNLERPPMVPQMSTDASADDQESDRLRKEIVASLSPLRLSIAANEPAQHSLQPGQPSENRASSVFPSEYDSYWADGDRTSSRPSQDIGRDIQHADPDKKETPAVPQPLADVLKPAILTRFSWEGSQTPSGQTQDTSAPLVPDVVREEERLPAPAVEQAGQESRDFSSDAFPNPYFGPAHTAANSQVPTSNVDIQTRAPTPPPELAKPVTSPTQTEDNQVEPAPVSGLHVVNSALHPEAVDLPPRLSREVSPVSQPARSSEEHPSAAQEKSMLGADRERSMPDHPSESGSAPPAYQEAPVTSPVTDKPLGSKDIATIKSPSERIANYNGTRDYWAHADHGLNDWVSSAVSANPELATQSFPQARPALAHSATSRHRTTPSISLFGKSSKQTTQNSASPTQTASPATFTPSPAGGGRSASGQINLAKGKDLLHTAGSLGGKGMTKGMTGAKGLFAKGKSRFGKDKEPETSSREGSEEPEFMTLQNVGRISIDADSPREEQKRRRFSSPFRGWSRSRSRPNSIALPSNSFSSPFHRSSRSRSRPSSIALPSNAFSEWGTPKHTPQGETPPAVGSCPISFHAPDEWNVIPESQSTPPTKGGLQAPDHLGVLPSPAKSLFSLPRDGDSDDVPPVPPIPHNVEEMERGRAMHGSASHRLLQSVIRNSTPPSMERSTLQSRLPNTSAPASETQEDAEAGHQEVQVQEVSDQSDRHRPQGTKAETIEATSLQNPHLEKKQHDGDDQPPQLSYDPIPPSSPSRSDGVIQNALFVPPHGTADVSPVMSAVGADRLDALGNEADLHLESNHNTLRPQLQLTIGDVSPMLSPTRPFIGNPGQETPMQVSNGAPGRNDSRPAYETEVIGGDVSPVSLRDKEQQQTAEPTGPTSARSSATTNARPEDVVVKIVTSSPSDKAAVAASGMVATPPATETSTIVHGQGLASRMHVLHAIEFAPSQTSLESFEQDSVAPSQSDGSQLGDRYDDSQIPPVPPMPSLVQQNGNTAKTVARESQPSTELPSSSSMAVDQAEPSQFDSHRKEPQQPVTSNQLKSSESLLSKISSMVSADGASISPASSHGWPSSKRPTQSSSARNSPKMPQHFEETASMPSQNMDSNASSNHDFDLYADHDGFVKDVQDESGQPLRVVDETIKAAEPAPRSQPLVPQSHQVPQSRDGPPRRYSEERPMSFVSGPPDVEGRPQDYINRPTTASRERYMHAFPRTSGKAPGKRNGAARPRQQPNLSQVQNAEQPAQYEHSEEQRGQNISPLHSHEGDRRTPSHSNVSSPLPSNASPPPQPNPPPSLSQRPLLPLSGSQNGHVDRRPHDLRPLQGHGYLEGNLSHGYRPGQSYTSDPPLPHNPEVRMQGQVAGQPPGPRNQYELQQQLWARQGMDPRDLRLGTGQQQNLGHGIPQPLVPPNIQSGKKEEKSSARSKLLSGLKGFGKSHASGPPSTSQSVPQLAPQLTQQPTSQTVLPLQHTKNPNPLQAAMNGNARPRPSLQPNAGDLPEQVIGKQNHSAAPIPSSGRPLSMETTSHLSQDSTKVQAAESRLDLRYPKTPTPLMGVPPELPPPGLHMSPTPQPQTQSQPQRVSTSGIPETGKKKRFSSLGNLFSRSGSTGQIIPSKAKPRKEDRKAQKAQNHMIAPLPPVLPQPSGQYWPPQQQYGLPQQGMQYGTARPFPSMQPQRNMAMPPPQTMYPQAQHQPYTIPPQGYSQALQPLQQRPQTQTQSSLPHVQEAQPQKPLPPMQETSAYVDTRRLAQTYQTPQAQFQLQTSPQSATQPRPETSRATVQSTSSRHNAQRTDNPATSISETNAPQDPRQVIPPAFAAQSLQPTQDHFQQHPQQHREAQQPLAPQALPNTRSVSSPLLAHDPSSTAHVSQRRVSSPPTEPQYETPQIPAAYTPVSGAYVSPGTEESPANIVDMRTFPAQHGRQYSEHQMQPISPQVSAMSNMPPNARQNSDSSAVSVVSPASNTSAGISSATPTPAQRLQKQRMTSITEQSSQERVWNMNLPHGATELEIVRARQRQYMEQQFIQAERTGRSPSPRSVSSSQSPSPHPPQPHQQVYQPPVQNGGGFRELLPRSSPQPYPLAQSPHQPMPDRTGIAEQHSPVQPTPMHPGQASHPTAYPLPMSPDHTNITSPVNPIAQMLPPPPPPKDSYTPIGASFSNSHSPSPSEKRRRQEHAQFSPTSHPVQDQLYKQPTPPGKRYGSPTVQLHPPEESRYPPPDEYQPPEAQSRHSSPHHHQQPVEFRQPEYDENVPAEEPPPYSGPGIPDQGMEKERHRPPNIMTYPQDRGRQFDARSRHMSMGMLQHPQPASMAASPQRSSGDMGADSLRGELLAQEERDRLDQIHRAELRRQELERERQERERARARARELERSVSGGGRVGSLRSAAGSTRSPGGWERRGDTARPVYELPTEDDEPVMRATSFPGQEWVPMWNGED